MAGHNEQQERPIQISPLEELVWAVEHFHGERPEYTKEQILDAMYCQARLRLGLDV